MRKITALSIALLCISFIASAQIEKGKILLGGDVNFQHRKDEIPGSTTSQTNTLFQISVGKAFKKNTVVGILLGYQGYNAKSDNGVPATSQFTSDIYNAGAFIRKYKDLGNDFSLFGQASINYFHGTNRGEVINSNPPILQRQVTNGVNAAFVPGISYKICTKLMVDLSIPNLISIGYNRSKLTRSDNNDVVKSTAFGVQTQLNNNVLSNVGFGFRLVL